MHRTLSVQFIFISYSITERGVFNLHLDAKVAGTTAAVRWVRISIPNILPNQQIGFGTAKISNVLTLMLPVRLWWSFAREFVIPSRSQGLKLRRMKSDVAIYTQKTEPRGPDTKSLKIPGVQ